MSKDVFIFVFGYLVTHLAFVSRHIFCIFFSCVSVSVKKCSGFTLKPKFSVAVSVIAEAACLMNHGNEMSNCSFFCYCQMKVPIIKLAPKSSVPHEVPLYICSALYCTAHIRTVHFGKKIYCKLGVVLPFDCCSILYCLFFKLIKLHV